VLLRVYRPVSSRGSISIAGQPLHVGIGHAGRIVTVEEAFFARLDPQGVPIWVAFMTHSNPFQQVHVDGTVATFTNNLDRSVVIDLDQPDFAP
jgi:hypothetical protein